MLHQIVFVGYKYLRLRFLNICQGRPQMQLTHSDQHQQEESAGDTVQCQVHALNDHVVHDNSCVHEIPHLDFRLGKSGVPNNSKLSLKHTKCTLDIPPVSLLALSKQIFFSLLTQCSRLSSQNVDHFG
jgi:hypothetical protein